MNRARTVVATLVLLVLVVLGSAGGSLSPVAHADATLPEVTAQVDGVPLDISAPNHVSLPATIVFTANMPVTIYYTTNGEVPTTGTATAAAIASAGSTNTGPTITSTDYMLMMLGVDADGSLTQLLTYTFVTP